MYAAGFLEGHLTAERTWDAFLTMRDYFTKPEGMGADIERPMKWCVAGWLAGCGRLGGWALVTRMGAWVGGAARARPGGGDPAAPALSACLPACPPMLSPTSAHACWAPGLEQD